MDSKKEFSEIQEELRRNLKSRAKRVDSINQPDSLAKIKELISRGKAIYGVDTREDPFSAKVIPRKVIAAVGIMFHRNRLARKEESFRLKTMSFGDNYRLRTKRSLCPGQKFIEQPVLGFGTCFLVNHDVVVTAAHCVDESEIQLESIRIIFDFECRRANPIVEAVKKSSAVFSIKEIICKKHEEHGADFAVIRLDRSTSIQPMTVSLDKITKESKVYCVGHPNGLPKKVATGAKVIDTGPDTHFWTNLDTFQGNSGSPVLNDKHEVCGILVRGEKDFATVPADDCDVALTFPIEKAGEEVCKASQWNHFTGQGKLAAISDVDSAGIDDSEEVGDEIDETTVRLALEAFFKSSFDRTGLELFIERNRELKFVHDKIYWDQAFDSVVAKTASTLLREGMVIPKLFDLLAARFPAKQEEVEDLRRKCLGK